jgi:hypothetical protein
MRITIEPTAEGQQGEYTNNIVVLRTLHDDVNAEDALDLVKRALVAWGFHWNNIYDE